MGFFLTGKEIGEFVHLSLNLIYLFIYFLQYVSQDLTVLGNFLKLLCYRFVTFVSGITWLIEVARTEKGFWLDVGTGTPIPAQWYWFVVASTSHEPVTGGNSCFQLNEQWILMFIGIHNELVGYSVLSSSVFYIRFCDWRLPKI